VGDEPLFKGRLLLGARMAWSPVGETYPAWDEWAKRRVVVRVYGERESLQRWVKREMDVLRNGYQRGFCFCSEGGDPPHLVFDACPLKGTLASLRLDWWEKAWLVWDVAKAVAHLHGRGFHRFDLSPWMVWVQGPTLRAWMTEGWTALAGRDDPLFKPDGPGVTPRLSSPELARGEAGDARSDVYMLGALTYLVVSGRWPVEGPSDPGEIRARVIRGEVAPLEQVAPHVDRPMVEIVKACMQPAPERRPPSAQAVASMIAGHQRLPKAREYALVSRGQWMADRFKPSDDARR
jgi:serine/threonine protein kinase